MVNYIETWTPPEDPLAVLKERYPGMNWAGLDSNLILEASAGVSQQMFPDDELDSNPLHTAYPEGTPEVLEKLLSLDFKGDILDRSAKIVRLVETYGMESLKHHIKHDPSGKILKEMAEDVEEDFGDGVGGESHNGDWMNGLEVSNPYAPDSRVLEKLLKLHKLNHFQTQRTNRLIPDPDGEIHKDLPVEQVEDLVKMSKLDLSMMDDDEFFIRFAEGSLTYEARYSFEPKGMNLVLLLDDSGSMSSTNKISWIIAVLHMLAKKMEQSSSNVLYIGLFEMYLSPFIKCNSASDVYDFIRKFRGGRGGDTDIAGAIQETSRRINSGELANSKTEIFVVNDGQDWIDDDVMVGHPVHTLTLFNDNDNLAKVSKQNGGTAFKVNYLPEGETLEEYT